MISIGSRRLGSRRTLELCVSFIPLTVHEGAHDEKNEQEIADSLPPFSELQLEAMYRGLAIASPAELSNPLLAAPTSALALPDPEREGEERKGRLSLLERRLGELERELAEEVEGEGGAARRVGEGETDGLAERLRRSRAGEGEVEEGEEVEVAQVDSSAQVEAYSPARVLLERIAELLPAEEVKKGEEKVEERGLAVPRGLLTRSEWTDLVLECVRTFPFLLVRPARTDVVLRRLRKAIGKESRRACD